MKSRSTSSEDDGSGGEGHSGGDSTDDVFLYDGVDVRDGLSDLDGTPQKTDKTGSRINVNFALSTQSVPTGRARCGRDQLR